MSSDRDIELRLKTIANTKGAKDVQKELDKLDKEIEQVEKSSKDLRKESDRLRSTKKDLAKQLDREADKLDEVARKARQTHDTYRDHGKVVGDVQAKSNDLIKSNKNMAHGFLEVSRAAEDLQYGFHSIVNNIPQIALYLGGSAGLASVASFAAIALNQLTKSADESGEEIEDLEETLKSFGDATVKNFKESLNDKNLLDEFTKSQSEAKKTADQLTESLKLQVNEARALRNVDYEVLSADSARKMAEINESNMPQSEKIAKITEIREKLDKVKQQNEMSDLQGQLSVLNSEISTAESKLSKLESKSAQLDTLDKDIRSAKEEQKAAKAEYEKIIEKLKSYPLAENLNNFKALDGSDNYASPTKQTIQSRIRQARGTLYDNNSQFSNALEDGDVEKAHEILKIYAELAAKNESLREADGTAKSLADKSLEKFSQLAEDTLNASKDLEKAASVLNQFETQKAENKDFIQSNKRQDLEKRLNDLASEQRVLDAKIKAQPDITSDNNAVSKLKSDRAIKSAATKDLQANAQKLIEGAENEAQRIAFEGIAQMVEQFLTKKQGESEGQIDALESSQLGSALTAAVQDTGARSSAAQSTIIDQFRGAIDTLSQKQEQQTKKSVRGIEQLGERMVKHSQLQAAGIERVSRSTDAKLKQIEQRLNKVPHH